MEDKSRSLDEGSAALVFESELLAKRLQERRQGQAADQVERLDRMQMQAQDMQQQLEQVCAPGSAPGTATPVLPPKRPGPIQPLARRPMTMSLTLCAASYANTQAHAASHAPTSLQIQVRAGSLHAGALRCHTQTIAISRTGLHHFYCCPPGDRRPAQVRPQLVCRALSFKIRVGWGSHIGTGPPDTPVRARQIRFPSACPQQEKKHPVILHSAPGDLCSAHSLQMRATLGLEQGAGRNQSYTSQHDRQVAPILDSHMLGVATR